MAREHFVIGQVVNVNGVRGRLLRLAGQIKDRTSVNAVVAGKMWAMVMENFKTESHEGEPWEPLAPSTIERRQKKQDGKVAILQDTGALRQSFMPFSNNDLAGVGSVSSREHSKLSEIHEEGLGNVPARPMLPSEGRAIAEAIKIYDHYIGRAIRQ